MSDSNLVTTDELNNQAKKIKELRAENARIAALKKPVSDALDLAEQEMIALLHKANLKYYPSPFGRATITHRSSVKTPKTPEAWESFLNYFREHDPDLYAAKVCVKSTDLNQYYKMKLEEAKAKGLDDLDIPGLDGVTIEENLSFTQS